MYNIIFWHNAGPNYHNLLLNWSSKQIVFLRKVCANDYVNSSAIVANAFWLLMQIKMHCFCRACKRVTVQISTDSLCPSAHSMRHNSSPTNPANSTSQHMHSPPSLLQKSAPFHKHFGKNKKSPWNNQGPLTNAVALHVWIRHSFDFLRHFTHLLTAVRSQWNVMSRKKDNFLSLFDGIW